MMNIRSLSKTFGENTILRNVSLTLKKGETVIIMGKSGAGKTTLLRILSMLEPYNTGRIEFEGYNYSKNPFQNSLEQRKKLSIVFQKPVALNVSVYENVSYGLKVRGIEKEIIEKKVTSILEKVGISLALYKVNPHTLSGGEIQRVALARALIIEPKLLLLDEPTANLDEENVHLFEKALVELKKNGMSIILATHDDAQAKRLGDRIYELQEGQLQVKK